MKKPRIGFVGVGRMGANMARRLHEAGYQISAIYDTHQDSAIALSKEIGGNVCASLSSVTVQSDVIFTVVTDDAAQHAVFFQSGDHLLMAAEGKTFINCATVSPILHEEIERAAEQAGASSLEVCMASSISQARAGTLYLMAGGKPAVFARVETILNDLSDHGRLLRYVGLAGQAAQVKALVNMVMNINTAGLAEGLGLGAALGLDVPTLIEIFSQTGAASRVLVTDADDMLKRDHECYFSASHAAKDSGIALALGQEKGMNLPLATATKQQYDRMVALGLGELDKSGVAELTFPDRSGKTN